MSTPATDMSALLTHLVDFRKANDEGQLSAFPDPAEPDDIGSALTQDEIDFLKRMIAEMQLRFNPPPPVL